MARKVNYAQSLVNSNTPQTEKDREDQVQNSAGGYVFQLDKWQYLRRFLILGTEGATYYVSEKTLTRNACKNVEACVQENMTKTLEITTEISDRGLAHKNDPAIFVLALCVANLPENQTIPTDIVNKIIRTGTHQLTFIAYLNELTKWKRRVKKVAQVWYNKPVDNLAYQMVKYQNRNSWTQADALRTVHVKPINEQYNTLFKWVTNKDSFYEDTTFKGTGIRLLDAYTNAHANIAEKELVNIIKAFGLTHEMIPTQFKKSAKVWEALTEKMPITAMIRNLGVMSASGLLTAHNLDLISKIEKNITDVSILQKGRVHPLGILLALKTYSQGHGFRGTLDWKPVQRVIDALDKAFYLAFKSVEPTGKRIMLAVDVSGSMEAPLNNSSLSCREAAAAIALITANTEPNHSMYMFSRSFSPLPISPSMRLDRAVMAIADLPFGGTDCALPMIEAQKAKAKYDVFIVITDCETWAGDVHPYRALRIYRKAINKNAKLIVVGMTSTGFTIADPTDGGMLDVVGFDASIPEVMRKFILGEV